MTAQQVVNLMTERDPFSKWLKLETDLVESGFCKLHYTVRHDMLNAFGSVHGGILFAASDSAFAFACNGHGILTVALEASISFVRPAAEMDILHVEAKEIHLGHKTGLYDVRTCHADGTLVSAFRGTAYRTGKAIE